MMRRTLKSTGCLQILTGNWALRVDSISLRDLHRDLHHETPQDIPHDLPQEFLQEVLQDLRQKVPREFHQKERMVRTLLANRRVSIKEI